MLLEVDYRIPLHLSGKNTLDNKNILHRHCYDQRHADFEASRRKAEQLREVSQETIQAIQMNGTQEKS